MRDSSVSAAILGRKTIVIRYNNPNGKTNNHKNGLSGYNQPSRIPVNLAQQDNKVCVNCYNVKTDKPQATVVNTSSLLKKRANRCTSGSQSSNCGNTNFKLQNPLNFTASSYINRQSTRASQCEINPNNAYKNFTQKTESITIDGITKVICCPKPIVKVTNTPSTSTFLRTQYFLDNCLPQKKENIATSKIMLNHNNCGASNGGC